MKPTDRFGVRVLVSDGTLPKWATLIFGEWESPEKNELMWRVARTASSTNRARRPRCSVTSDIALVVVGALFDFDQRELIV